MFAFFVNNEFKGYWSNKPQDIFFDNTCDKLGWEKSLTTLVHFNGLKESELEHSLVSSSNVKIRTRSVSQVQQVDEFNNPVLDNEGNPVLVEEESFTVVKTIYALPFVNNGEIIIPC